jgi:purine nucleoside permease
LSGGGKYKAPRFTTADIIVNYDQPYPGLSVLESVDASSGAFSIGMRNGFLVGSAVIDELVKTGIAGPIRFPEQTEH